MEAGFPNLMPEEAAFWKLVVQKGLPRMKFLRRSTPPEVLDHRFSGTRLQVEWEKLKAQMQPGDKIWPFDFNLRPYLGLRRGYILLRRGQPVHGIVTEVS